MDNTVKTTQLMAAFPCCSGDFMPSKHPTKPPITVATQPAAITLVTACIYFLIVIFS